MKGTTHREIALASSIAVGITHFALSKSFITPVLSTALVPLLWIPLAPIGGYLPDIDKKGTTPNRWFKKYHYIFYILVVASLLVLPWYFSAVFLVSFSLFEILILKSLHRRETHSLLFLIVMSAVFLFTSSLFSPIHEYVQIFVFNILFGLVFGALTHDIADMYNLKMVHFCYPVEMWIASKDRPRRIIPRLGNIVTGTPEEDDFKNRWMILCGLVTLGLVVPSALGFIGVTIPYIIEGSFLFIFTVIVVMQWQFFDNMIRMSLVIIILLTTIYVIIVTFFPELTKFNFIRSLFT